MEILHRENPVLALYWPCTGLQCIHKTRILRKRPLEKTFLDYKKWANRARVIMARVLHTVLFTYLLTAWLTVSIKPPGLGVWKKSLLNNQYILIFFSNSRSLEQPGLTIEILEYQGI